MVGDSFLRACSELRYIAHKAAASSARNAPFRCPDCRDGAQIRVPILAVSLELYDDTTNTKNHFVRKVQWFDETSGVGKQARPCSTIDSVRSRCTCDAPCAARKPAAPLLRLQSGAQVRNKRVLIMDEVDDTRTTLKCAPSQRRRSSARAGREADCMLGAGTALRK